MWDSSSSTFAGLLTTSDYINVIQYYWQNPAALGQIDKFKLSNLRGGHVLSANFVANYGQVLRELWV